MKLMPAIERYVVPLQLPRGTFALLLALAFAAGVNLSVWVIALFFHL
jgi:hypothetical protein